MAWGFLADVLVVVHLAFIVFAVLGGFLAWRWKPILLAHVPALTWAAWIELTGGICPLTPLEVAWRLRAGEGGYMGELISYFSDTWLR